eukprot:3757264-Amphidinium_carterae.1
MKLQGRRDIAGATATIARSRSERTKVTIVLGDSLSHVTCSQSTKARDVATSWWRCSTSYIYCNYVQLTSMQQNVSAGRCQMRPSKLRSDQRNHRHVWGSGQGS